MGPRGVTVFDLAPLSPHSRFHTAIGVGGIGTGMFFALSGNDTLGREESRAGRIVDRRDYCKLHIVSHYLQVLLGPSFNVIPVGMVGEDEAGKTLLGEMRETGMNTGYVRTLREAGTLFSFCLLYPDGSGANLTTDDSASAALAPDDVRKVERELEKAGSAGIALALPEVPLESRKKLLELATAYGLFRVASFTTQEIDEAIERHMFELTDHLALNIDEAARIAGRSYRTPEKMASLLMEKYPHLGFSITAGEKGSWVREEKRLLHIPACEVDAVSAAGAGDAYLAGFIAGIVCGLGPGDSARLGSLTGALSVTSPHTIHKGLDAEAVRRLALDSGYPLTAPLRSLLCIV
ncbi:MAG: carbohydrate kinase family protein [Spirochaetes bacterium]|nr:carbohydrate kinase family protein [Spirochaetota bacterium]